MLKELGHRVIGVTMTLGRDNEEAELDAARKAAENLDIELKVFDFSGEWHRLVIEYIRSTYQAGRTPNPCIRCNETVKMRLLPQAAFELGCDHFATGHYARLATGADGRVTLMRARDRAKDQSYFLYRVDRETLKRTIFPLGGMTKSEVREYALGRGIKAAGKTDSQDFCGGDVLEIAGAEIPGDIVDMSGRKLGRHRGFWHYTVGKRKGLGIGGGTPYYVVALNAARNEVVVGFKEDTVRFDFDISDVVGGESLQGELAVKIRSGGEPKGPVTVKVNADGSAKVFCPSGISGVAPGQSAVFYRGDEVIGGGIILANT
jgi:tRNA-specific 2-thiouridylase